MKKIVPVLIILSAYCCFLLLPKKVFAQLKFGKSYINVSRGNAGGTFRPGDTLEIRATLANGNTAKTITEVRYNDTIPANTTYLNGTLKILTNEGLVYKSFTDGAGDDGGMYDFLTKTIRINVGKTPGICSNTGIAPLGGGTVKNTDKPSFYLNTCITMVVFRVRISVALPYGTLLTINAGAFRYTDGVAGQTNFSPFPMMLYRDLGLCPNLTGANVIIDNNGTFGSGITQVRSSSAIVPNYPFVAINANVPNDSTYTIVNNSSANGTTNPNTPVPDLANPTSRVFRVWDIIGDHTGALSPTLGNPPTAPGTNGGYMLLLNANYATNATIQQSVSGLCPNTYYEFSAWFRNVCRKCACDSNGRGATSAGYLPPPWNDSAGVRPNLTFQIDGIDYLTTGDLAYSGTWVKKGFNFLTGPLQTSCVLTIRNNAPGGGGNDWAMDDIILSTCYPNLNFTPSPVFSGCVGNPVSFSVKVNSFFNNYTQFKWQKSTDNGATYNDAGINGTGSPVFNGTDYEYTVAYPPFLGNTSDSGNKYRLVVATTVPNLGDPNCSFSNSTGIITLDIKQCIILGVELVQFTGHIQNNRALLQWVTENETEKVIYTVERSDDGSNFSAIGEVQGSFNQGQSSGNYSFTDPRPVSGKTFYRLRMSNTSRDQYSRIIVLSNDKLEFELRSVINPFSNSIRTELFMPENGQVLFRLYDAFGKLILKKQPRLSKGFNNFEMYHTENLSRGIYILKIDYEETSINRKLMKE